jgi:hypothetical protein
VGIMTLVMLYRTTVKSEAIEQLNEIRNQFSEIYSELGIEVLGHWRNAENQNETVYMVKYESESDYQHKTMTLQEDERYVQLTAKLNSIRTDFKPEKLVSA